MTGRLREPASGWTEADPFGRLLRGRAPRRSPSRPDPPLSAGANRCYSHWLDPSHLAAHPGLFPGWFLAAIAGHRGRITDLGDRALRGPRGPPGHGLAFRDQAPNRERAHG